MKFILIYILTIFLVNLGFSVVPLVDLGFGTFSPMAAIVGIVFVVRDFAQRAVGHWVWIAMLIGCGLSYWMADPFVAIASVTSFFVSEAVDWLLYTVTKKPFHKRVLWSSLLATPIDTAVFLFMIDLTNPATFIMMVACKMIAAFGIYWYGEKTNKPSLTSSS